MNCRSAEELFSSFVEDELSQRERRTLEDHLADCPRCSRSVEELRATVDLLTALPSYETGPAFEEEVMDRIRSGEALRPGIVEWITERVSGAWLKPVFLSGAAACALYIAFLVGGAYMQSPNMVADASKTASVTPSAAKTVAPSTTPVPARVAPSPVIPSNDVVASASPRRAPAVNAPVQAANTADSASAVQNAPYQDEYIQDQFYLNRSSEEGVHSIVPVSGRPTDDVYITF